MCEISINLYDWDWSESEGKRPKPTPLPHMRIWFLLFPAGEKVVFEPYAYPFGYFLAL